MAACCCGDQDGTNHGTLVPCECFDAGEIPFCGMTQSEQGVFCNTVIRRSGICYDVLCNPPNPLDPPCQPGEAVWGDLGISAGDIEEGGCSSDDPKGCCYEKPPEVPCEIVFPDCCQPGQTANAIIFDLNIKGGHSTFGRCVCSGGRDSNSAECFGEIGYHRQGTGGVIQIAPLCQPHLSGTILCGKDMCGTVDAVPSVSPGGVQCPTVGIPNCDQADSDCCQTPVGNPPATECITDPYDFFCGGGTGDAHTCVGPPDCPKGCTMWGCGNFGYKMVAGVTIPCKKASGGSNVKVKYEGRGILTVPGFDWVHLCLNNSNYQDIGCTSPQCQFGGTPPANLGKSHSLGAVSEISVPGIWRGDVGFTRASTSDPCAGWSSVGVWFTPDDFAAHGGPIGWGHLQGGGFNDLGQRPGGMRVAGSHPCQGDGVNVQGRFDWAQAVKDNNPGMTASDATQLLTYCGPGQYLPAVMNASKGDPPGGSNSLVRDFFEEYGDNFGGSPVSGLKLDKFRQLATAFNVWGRNPGSSVTDSSGFSGCIPEGGSQTCNACPSSAYEWACNPSKAKIDHTISIVAS